MFALKALYPKALLLFVVLLYKVSKPTAALLLPITLFLNEKYPNAVLFDPIVFTGND